MIILDTNVVSELMRKAPDSNVLEWVRQNSENDLAITSLTIFEILWGIEKLPKGAKRQRLETSFETFLYRGFAKRIFGFNEGAARQTALLCMGREKKGHHVHQMDIMIAGIARLHDSSIATRNVHDFNHCNLNVINPWATNS